MHFVFPPPPLSVPFPTETLKSVKLPRLQDHFILSSENENKIRQDVRLNHV